MSYPILTAAEAACYINNGDGVGISGFTLSGTPKTVLPEVAKRAEEAHAAGKPFKINLFTGASTGDSIDGVLTRAKALNFKGTVHLELDDTRCHKQQGDHICRPSPLADGAGFALRIFGKG